MNEKSRSIVLNLSDEEVAELSKMACAAGRSVGSLLEDFIADLTQSPRSGGVDEELSAKEWYDRRGYQYEDKVAFPVYLARTYNPEQFYAYLDDYETFALEIQYLKDHPEEDEPGRIDSLTQDLEETRRDLEVYLDEYRGDCDSEATLESIIVSSKDYKKALTEHGRAILENDSTAGRTGGEERSSAELSTVETLERLQSDLYDLYGVSSKPSGLMWVSMALDLVKRITSDPELLNRITETDLEQLTEANAHTARHAAEIALYLMKYTV